MWLNHVAFVTARDGRFQGFGHGHHCASHATHQPAARSASRAVVVSSGPVGHRREPAVQTVLQQVAMTAACSTASGSYQTASVIRVIARSRPLRFADQPHEGVAHQGRMFSRSHHRERLKRAWTSGPDGIRLSLIMTIICQADRR
jgi:hypothetical protein